MKKTALIIATIALAGFLVTSPVYSYTPPAQGTDNATDVILWYSDNITIESANVTGTITVSVDMSEVGNAGDAVADGMTSILESLLPVFLLVFVTVLAYWHRERYLYVPTAFGLIAYGFSYWSTLWYIGLMLIGAGIVTIMKAFWEKK